MSATVTELDMLLKEIAEACKVGVSALNHQAARSALELIGLLGDYYLDRGDEQMANACLWCCRNGKRPFSGHLGFVWFDGREAEWTPSDLPGSVFEQLKMKASFSSDRKTYTCLVDVFADLAQALTPAAG